MTKFVEKLNQIYGENNIHKAIKTRAYWIEEIRKLSGNFGVHSDRLEKELEDEIKINDNEH